MCKGENPCQMKVTGVGGLGEGEDFSMQTQFPLLMNTSQLGEQCHTPFQASVLVVFQPSQEQFTSPLPLRPPTNRLFLHPPPHLFSSESHYPALPEFNKPQNYYLAWRLVSVSRPWAPYGQWLTFSSWLTSVAHRGWHITNSWSRNTNKINPGNRQTLLFSLTLQCIMMLFGSCPFLFLHPPVWCNTWPLVVSFRTPSPSPRPTSRLWWPGSWRAPMTLTLHGHPCMHSTRDGTGHLIVWDPMLLFRLLSLPPLYLGEAMLGTVPRRGPHGENAHRPAASQPTLQHQLNLQTLHSLTIHTVRPWVRTSNTMPRSLSTKNCVRK